MRNIIIFCFIFLPLQAFCLEKELSFGVYTSDKPSDMVQKFRPVLNELQNRLSTYLDAKVTIKLKVFSSYEKGINALVNREVDFVRFGPASYILSLQQDPGINLLAMESYKGKKTFKGIIVVQADSPIQNLAELKGKRFAFGNENSTIGRYLSQLALLDVGVTAKDLASYSYLGRHDKVGAVVSIGQYDAGALKESSYKKIMLKGANLRELYAFDNVTKPWLTRSGLSVELTKGLKESLLSMPKFLAADVQDYARIKQAIIENVRFFH